MVKPGEGDVSIHHGAHHEEAGLLLRTLMLSHYIAETLLITI